MSGKRKKPRRGESGNPQLRDPELRAEAAERGVTPSSLLSARQYARENGFTVEQVLESSREVSTVVGGEDPEIVGLLTEPGDTSKVIGAVPGTPAAKLTPEEIALKMGLDVDELIASVFHKTDVASMRDSADSMDRAVYEELRKTTLEGAEHAVARLERESAEAAEEARALMFKPRPGGSPKRSITGGASPAVDLVHSMIHGETRMPRSQAEAEQILREQGYEQVGPAATATDQANMQRLDRVVNDPELLDRVRKFAPGIGMDEEGRWTGMDDARRRATDPEAVEELLAALSTPHPDREVAAARRKLFDMVRSVEPAAEAGAPILGLRDDEAMNGAEAQRVIAITIDAFLASLRMGEVKLGATEVKPDDVQLYGPIEGRQVEVSGMLADAVVLGAMIASADEPTLTPEALAQRAVDVLDQRLTVVSVQPSGDIHLNGDTALERANSLACMKQMQYVSSEEDRAALVQLKLPEPVRISYVGMAHLVGVSHVMHRTAVKPRVAVTEDTLREMRQDGYARLGAAARIQREGLPTIVRLAFHVDLRPAPKRATRTTIWVHDVDPRTAEALMGTGPLISERRALTESLLAGLPTEYHLGTEDRPRWAGARAFDTVWDRAQRTARLGWEAQQRGVTVWEMLAQQEVLTPAIRAKARATVGYSQQAVRDMQTAQEVLVDPDQINMLPPFDTWEEAVRFASDVQLPFERIFLDLEGPASSCVSEPVAEAVEGARLSIRGALVERAGRELVIMPFGTIVVDGEEPDADDTYGVLGQIVFGRSPLGAAIVSAHHAAISSTETTSDLAVWAQQVVLDDGFMFTNIAADAHVSEISAAESPEELTVTVRNHEGSGASAYTLLDADDGTEYDKTQLALHVSQLRIAGLAVLRALYLLTMSNVELVEGGTRQIRRAALRRDPEALISLLVKVVTSRKDYRRGGGESEGNRREYAYRFRRRGSVAHYPVGTRMADADPTLVRACGRCGRCRRIFRPATIVGPDDKPLVLKSLKLD